MATSPKTASWLRVAPSVSGAVVILLGVLALAGWQLGNPYLTSLVPGRVAMNPATAICFMLSGVSIAALRPAVPLALTRGGGACAWLVMTAGCAKLVSLFVHGDAGFDHALFPAQLDAAVPPNRMAPNTALNFLGAGLALVLARGGSGAARRSSKYIALVPFLLSFLGLTGYVYDVRSFYAFTQYIPMALNTVLGFLVLTSGTLLLHPAEGPTRVLVRDDLGGSLARKLFPVSIGALFLLGWLRLMGQGLGLYDVHVGVSLHVFVSCVILGVVILTSADSLSLADEERQRAAEALRRANDGLELHVQTRTAELVAANEALHKSEDQLRQSQKMEAIGRLAGGVAHDFNNMLTAILGHSQLMRMRLQPQDPAYRDTQEIELAAKRAGSLTRQLLAFSRQQVLEPKVLDLNVLISEMDRMLRRLIGADIDILTAPAPELYRVKADPGQIEQVLLNLVVNARDAMPHGGKITIETANVTLDELYAEGHPGVNPGPHALLAVSDNGCGIDPKQRARIFEPFFTTKDAGKGTGLGLSTVYGIVKQSGGHVDVYSEVGVGTTFKVYLPRAEGPVPEAAATPRPGLATVRGTETVLVVEDEDLVRAVIRRTLEANGYRVLEADNGRGAIHVLETTEGTVDLLITDVMMPLMTGPEVAARALRWNAGLKVLFISGYTDKAVIHHGILSEGTAYVQKPFSPEVLARRVREVLDGPQAEVA